MKTNIKKSKVGKTHTETDVARKLEKAESEIAKIYGNKKKIILLTGGKKYENIPEGIYKAVIVDIKESSFKGVRKTLTFVFRILSEDYFGIELNGYTNINYKTISNECKLGKWWKVLTGEELLEEAPFDVGDFIGKVFLVDVKDTKTNFGNKFSNVSNLIELVFDD